MTYVRELAFHKRVDAPGDGRRGNTEADGVQQADLPFEVQELVAAIPRMVVRVEKEAKISSATTQKAMFSKKLAKYACQTCGIFCFSFR